MNFLTVLITGYPISTALFRSYLFGSQDDISKKCITVLRSAVPSIIRQQRFLSMGKERPFSKLNET